MSSVLGVYFSGTGNTKHCVEHFVKQYDANAKAVPMESPRVAEEISAHDTLVVGYPIYFSNAPKIVQDFIAKNKACFTGKKIFIIATMAMFSGDGSGCTARMFRRYHATILGGLHLKLPDSIGDEKVLKKSPEQRRQMVLRAEQKITSAVSKLKEGSPTQDGLSFLAHVAGLLGQRLWFYSKATNYHKKPNIDGAKCIGCGRCAAVCPTKNLAVVDRKAVSGDQCTLCYRCFSLCPVQAITILGNRVHMQYRFENP